MQNLQKTFIERWESDGGAVAPLRLLHLTDGPSVVPHIDHKRPPDDDSGTSPHPIYGDYVKDLWRSHTRSGGVPSLVRSRSRIGGRNDCEKLPQ